MTTFLAGGLATGFLKSWGMILVSEIGDKTFFIAAVMAMKNSRQSVFGGAAGALAAMTVLSALMGWAAPTLISKQYTQYGAALLFFIFGFKMLYEVFTIAEKGNEASEWDEAEKDVKAAEAAKAQSGNKPTNGRINGSSERRQQDILCQLFSPVFLEAFVLTFCAEWGDRSQIATIGLAASANVVGVSLGGILGHCMCTGGAVLGGRQLAAYVAEQTLAVIGGVLFLVFGVQALYEGLYS
ncbi:hypothetical protein ABBQ32_007684 [Trebouxia sp. C0010 RCD-2024]